jgi:hypothetical protein
MTTRRVRLVAIVGLVIGILLSGGLGSLSSVSAQATKSGIKAKARETGQQAMVKWDSLTAEQQQQLAQKWQMDVAKAQQKWESMTPEQQQQALGTAKAGVQKAKGKWQALPQGTTTTKP